ncbi:MAG: methylmalonyl Co-A mutase-associated GTPase MeaB [Thermoplasmata archaeon]|jgi:LAO/AO transport system kinase
MSRAEPLSATVRAIRRRELRALAQSISRIERDDPAFAPVERALYGETGRAMVVGITGPLGVGKSSLVSRLIAHLRSAHRTVAVVAVDPSSPFSGGSVLGDRIRMERDDHDSGVFIRSMASRGHSGGIALATRRAVRLLDAAGFEVILVETVGSGQVDVDIRDVASTSVVVLIPHLGDEVQTLKAGLFEIADVFCVNKSDLPGADQARRDLVELVAFGTPRDGWRPLVAATSTTLPSGIDELWGSIERHERFLDEQGLRLPLRRRQVLREIIDLIQRRVEAEILPRADTDPEVRRLVDRVVGRALDPPSAARRLLGAPAGSRSKRR